MTKPVGLAVLLVLLIVVPLFIGGYWVEVLSMSCINLILVMSFSLIAVLGRISFAHIAVMALGAYASTLLTTKFLSLSFWLALPLGGLAAALFALLISYPVLRTRGVSFFLSTVAAGIALTQVFIRFPLIFGGNYGIPGIPYPDAILGIDFASPIARYYLMLAVALLSVVIIYRLRKSRIGTTIKAVASSDSLCESVGINTFRYETLIFVVGSFFAGIAGVLFAHHQGVIAPENFTMDYMFKVIVWTIVGGTTTFVGPIIGLVMLTLVSELTRHLAHLIPLIYGVVIVVVLLFLPQGLVSIPRRMSPLVRKIQNMIKRVVRWG